jgi:hypothetical protein
MQIELSEIEENVLDEFQLMFNFINDKDMNIRLSVGNRVLGAKLFGYDNIYLGFLAKYVTLGATWDLVEQTFVHRVLLIENSDSLMLHSFVSKLHFEDIAYSSVNLDGIFYSNNFVRLNPIIAVYDEFEGNEWMYYRDNLIFIPEIDSFFPLNYDIQSYFLQKIRINYRIQMNVSDEYFSHYVMLEVGNLDLIENITLNELYNKTNPYFQFIAEIQYTDLNYTDIIIEYEFVEYWVISYNIEELTFGSFIRSIIVPTILIVIFAICGYVLLKVKGVIYSLEISFIILYVINRMSFISLILLSIFELIFVIYNIKQKGVKVE